MYFCDSGQLTNTKSQQYANKATPKSKRYLQWNLVPLALHTFPFLTNILKTSQLPLNKTSFWRSENNYFLWVLRKSCQKQLHIFVAEMFLTYFTVWSNHFGWMLQNWSNKSATSFSYLDDTAQWTQEHSPAFILNHGPPVWFAPVQQRWGLERLSRKQTVFFFFGF